MFYTERKALEFTEEKSNILPTGEVCLTKYHVIQRFFWTHFEYGHFKVSVKIPLPALYFHDRTSSRQYWLSWTGKTKRIISRKKVAPIDNPQIVDAGQQMTIDIDISPEYPEPITR